MQTKDRAVGDASPLARQAALKKAALTGKKPAQEADGKGPENRPVTLNQGSGQARRSQGASAQVSGHRYLLKVAAREDGWIKIIIDSQKPEEFHLQAGNHLQLPAESGYNILLGNAGGMELFLNGRPIPVFGKSGQIVTLQVP